MVIKGRKIKTATLLKLVYLILLISVFFYVKSVLRTDTFTPAEKTPREKATEVKEAKVALTVETGEEVKQYKTRLTNADTVKDFLSELRDKQGLYYEVDLYTYGTEIVSVFGKEAESGYKWTILLDGKDITNRITNEYLINSAAYMLKQTTTTHNAEQQ